MENKEKIEIGDYFTGSETYIYKYLAYTSMGQKVQNMATNEITHISDLHTHPAHKKLLPVNANTPIGTEVRHALAPRVKCTLSTYDKDVCLVLGKKGGTWPTKTNSLYWRYSDYLADQKTRNNATPALTGVGGEQKKFEMTWGPTQFFQGNGWSESAEEYKQYVNEQYEKANCQHQPVNTGIPGGSTWCKHCDKTLQIKGETWEAVK